MLTLVLYPYVYLLARTAFLEQRGCVLEVSRTLGAAAWRSFFGVALPLARPAIAAGVALVLMETLADYGAVRISGSRPSPPASTAPGSRSATASRRRSWPLSCCCSCWRCCWSSAGRAAPPRSTTPPAATAACPATACAGCAALRRWSPALLPLLLGFFVPAARCCGWRCGEGDAQFGPRFLRLARNSFLLAALTAAARGGAWRCWSPTACALRPSPRAEARGAAGAWATRCPAR